MKRLLDAGLVEREQRGKWAYFALKSDAVEPTNLNYSGGLGLRVRARSAIVSRIDFAFSREGVRFIWTFSDIFKPRW